MINSINPKVELYKKNPFDIVSQNLSNTSFWLNNNTMSQDNKSLSPEIVPVSNSSGKKKNAKLIGLSIAGTVVLVAGTIFLLLSGGPKGLAKGFQKLRTYYEKKLQKSKLSGLKTGTHYEYIIGKIDKFQKKAEAINNFTTIKDFMVKKIMYGPKNNWTFSRKIHSGITNLFEKIGLKTVKKSYKKTSEQFELLEKLNKNTVNTLRTSIQGDEKLTINGVTKSKFKWLNLLEENSQRLSLLYTNGFSDTVKDSRYLRIKKFTKELEQNFEKQGPLWFLSKDTFNSFVAESKILPRKLQLQSQIKQIMQSISYTPNDLYNDVDAAIMRISSYLSVNDKDALKKLNIVKEAFKSFSKGDKTLNKDMLAIINDLSISVLNSAKNAKNNDEAKSMISALADIKSLYLNYKQGQIQDILDIYKCFLPASKYLSLEKEYNKAAKLLNKSVKLETEDFINKSRDLTLGSAPTDILTVLGGFATLAYYLGKSDSNREKVAIALKYGIPALAGVGVSLYGNARLFAGTKSMMLGVVSSIIVGKIGSMANNLINKYYKKLDYQPAENSNI